MNSEKKIYHDFQSLDEQRRLILNLNGTLRDLKNNDIALSEGLKLLFWDDETDEAGRSNPLIASGEVHFNSKINQWVAEIEWDKIK